MYVPAVLDGPVSMTHRIHTHLCRIRTGMFLSACTKKRTFALRRTKTAQMPCIPIVAPRLLDLFQMHRHEHCRHP